MSKKNLLNEATIRRFMKLASLGPLTETFLPEEEEIEVDAEEVIEEPPAEEVEVDVEVEETGLSVGDVEDALAAGLGAMAAELEEAIPELELNIDAGDAGEELDVEDDLDLDMDMGDVGDEEDLEADAFAGDEEVEDDEFEMDEKQKWGGNKGDKSKTRPGREDWDPHRGSKSKTRPGREDFPMNEEDAQAAFFASVMEKVDARLAEEKQDQLADELTERIFKRLTQKKNS